MILINIIIYTEYVVIIAFYFKYTIINWGVISIGLFLSINSI